MKFAAMAAAMSLAAFAQAPAMATDVDLTTTLTANSSPDFCVFGTCALKASNGVNSYSQTGWSVGDSANLFLGNLSVKPGYGWDSNASVDLTLAFTQPAEATQSTGAAVQYLHAFGHILPGVTAGSITWDDNAYAFAIGDYHFELDLQNLTGWTLDSPVSLYGTLKLTGVPTPTGPGDSDGTPAVPEPASWAMMLGGFGLVGAAMRRRKAVVRFA